MQPLHALDRDDRARPRVGTPTRTRSDEREEKVLRCRSCETEIARDGDRIEMSGAHAHTFVNPHGHVFEIGCFARAPGCAAIGPPSAFFSWFPGYAWRMAVCGNCRAHLGWSFGEAPALRPGGPWEQFFALVLPRLL